MNKRPAPQSSAARSAPPIASDDWPQVRCVCGAEVITRCCPQCGTNVREAAAASPPPPAPCAVPAQPPGGQDLQVDAVMLQAIGAANMAGRAAREQAIAEGTPALAREILMDPVEAPEIPGYGKPCRMTAAMQQIMVRWAKLPDGCQMADQSCLGFCFLSPLSAWALLQEYDPAAGRWTSEAAEKAWKDAVMRLALFFTTHQEGEALQEALAHWMHVQINRFFVSPGEKTREPNQSPPVAREAAPDGGSGPSTASQPSTPEGT